MWCFLWNGFGPRPDASGQTFTTTTKSSIKIGTNWHCPDIFTSKAGMSRSTNGHHHPSQAVDPCRARDFGSQGFLHEASKRVFNAFFMYTYGLLRWSANQRPCEHHHPLLTMPNPNAEFSPPFWILCRIYEQMFYKRVIKYSFTWALQLNQYSPFPPLPVIDWGQVQWSFDYTLQLNLRI